MSGIIIEERLVRGVTILDIAGKIAIGESNRQLHDSIKRLVAEGKNQIIVDLAKVSHIDSSGLGELVGGYTTLKAAGGALKLVNVNDRVTSLMTITKLYTVFDIFDNELDAVSSFGEPQPLSASASVSSNFDPEIVANSSVH